MRLGRRSAVWVAAVPFLLSSGISHSEPSLTGQNGLIHMPDGRVPDDGTLRFGYSYAKPYDAFWGSIGLLPFLEVTGAYTHTQGTANSTPFWQNYGDFKDKEASIKLRLLDEVARDEPAVIRDHLLSETGLVYTLLAHAAGRLG